MLTSANQKQPTLLVFADDWGRHPSSCQHLISSLLAEHDVCWVNTIGTRSPKLSTETLARGLEKLAHWFAPSAKADALPPRLRVVNPRMWPSFKSRFARGLNKTLLLRQLVPLVESLPQPVVAITTLPITADLVGRLPVDRWVYYCVDDFGEWPGLDREVLHAMEEELVARVDDVIVVSETLRRRIESMGKSSTMLTHGVDLQHWQVDSTRHDDQLISTIAPLERPLIVFWGVVDRRLDMEFLTKLNNDLSEGTILLVGPENNPASELKQLSRVQKMSPVSYASLPQLAEEATVLIMPYADLPVTRAMQPLKLKEYMVTGKPVVVRDLPACQPWGDCLDLATDAESFSRLVRERIAGGIPSSQVNGRLQLVDESWESKAREFRRAVCGAQDERPDSECASSERVSI